MMQDTPKTEHIYDGIEEFDNPLPGWWKWLFVATIAFAPLYWIYYHGGAPDRSVADQFEAAFAEDAKAQFKELGELTPDAQTLANFAQLADKAKFLNIGKTIFKTNCIACHGRNAEGSVGPNLTDQYFKNIRKIDDIATVVSNGASGNAMPAWKNKLLPNEIVLVSAYVASLRGTDVPGKGADGQEIAPWPEPIEDEPASKDGDGPNDGDGAKDGDGANQASKAEATEK